MIPPMLMRIATYEGGVKKINLWLPLVFLYLLLLPLFLLVLPFLLVIGLIAWFFGVGATPVSWLSWLYELWCASKGTVIETKSKTGRVLIEGEQVNGVVRLHFKDDGPGIPSDIVGKIFEPFFTTKPVGKGTGLGLSICYGIIKQHHGDLRVNSTPGSGATFTVELPIYKSDENN